MTQQDQRSLKRLLVFVFLPVAFFAAAILPASSPSAAATNSYLRVLTWFQTLEQGDQPMSAVTMGGDGTLYGTTNLGGEENCAYGKFGCGEVFALRRAGTTWTLSTIYAFRGGSDGAGPVASVLVDRNGVIYGTTNRGGNGCSGGCGTVFKLTPSGPTYKEAILYSFRGGSDGSGPTGKLVVDGSGALYGLTARGGTGSACINGQYGCGTAYKLTPSGSGYTESVLHAFQGGSTDGAIPGETALTVDRRGNLFGTTVEGGNQICSDGCGSIFELTPSGQGYVESILHFFTGTPDGARPYGGMIYDIDGALYGTTEIGGDLSACPSFGGCGTVFKLARSKTGFAESVVYSFVAGKDAYGTSQALVADASGALYGASPGGGYAQVGVLFKLTPNGSGGFIETVLHDFHLSQDGYGPYGSLIVNKGLLYGTAISGPYGSGGGEVFEFKQ